MEINEIEITEDHLNEFEHDTVPAKKKLKFLTKPKNIAVVVKQPKIKPKPISVSPQGTMTLNTSTFGKAKCFKKSTYHPTAPSGPFTGFAILSAVIAFEPFPLIWHIVSY
jgi:hypothetical protein